MVAVETLQSAGEISIRALSPENDEHRELAHVADAASLEAYNPSEYTNELMTPEQLEAHMRGDQDHMVRYLIVDPIEFERYVDMDIFRAAMKKNPTLEVMQQYGIIGYTYIYDDSKNDDQFLRRANIIREQENLPSDAQVFEMNIWYVPGTKDEHVIEATRETVHEFSQPIPGATAVMFVALDDMKEAYQDATGETISSRKLDRESTRLEAEGAMQDVRVLHALDARYGGRIYYLTSDKGRDFAYIFVLQPQQLYPSL